MFLKRLPRIKDYPKQIEVNGVVWDIKFVRVIKDGNGCNVGLCDESTHTIYIRLKQGLDATFATFLHEVIHCFEFSHNFEIPHKTVYFLEEAIFAFFLANWGSFTLQE